MHNVRLGSKYLAIVISNSVHRIQKMAVVHFTTIPSELNTTNETNYRKSYFFKKFVLALTTLFMSALKFS